MKIIKSSLMLLIATIVLQSCKKEDNNIPAPKVYKQLEKAKWFVGHWDNVVSDAHFTENWTQKNDSTLLGKSYVTVANDTVFAEEVDLIQRNDSLFYVVSIEGENSKKPVSFYMTKASKNELVFENPKHDFPTKITYLRITDGRMIATISGIKDGKEIKEEYQFKRVEK